MISRSHATPILALMACISLFTGACAGSEGADERSESAGAETGEMAATELDTAGTESPAMADSIAAAHDQDPFHGFDLDSVAEARNETSVARLLLHNDSQEDAVVYGTGGAGEILLDTVPRESERRVDVTTRAVRLGVRSETLAGEGLRQDEVTVGVDTIINISVGRVTAIP